MSSSRHRFSTAQRDAEGRLYLSPPEPFGYVDLPDNILHVAATGDTPWSIAAQYYPTTDGALFFWAIVGFQPEPIFHDPTVQVPEGTIVHVPSWRTVETRILSRARRAQ